MDGESGRIFAICQHYRDTTRGLLTYSWKYSEASLSSINLEARGSQVSLSNLKGESTAWVARTSQSFCWALCEADTS